MTNNNPLTIGELRQLLAECNDDDATILLGVNQSAAPARYVCILNINGKTKTLTLGDSVADDDSQSCSDLEPMMLKIDTDVDPLDSEEAFATKCAAFEEQIAYTPLVPVRQHLEVQRMKNTFNKLFHSEESK